MLHRHCIVRALVLVWLVLGGAGASLAATQEAELLRNGSFEESAEGAPVGWLFPGHLVAAGYTLELDTDDPLDGEQSARLDSTGVDDGRSFGMLNQSLDALLYRGKRVRFRAAVRTSERGEGGRAQLWLRSDSSQDGGESKITAFDNMGDRPITSDEWQHYEIVADIDEHAVRLTVGVLAIASLKLWIDDASFEVLDVDAMDEEGEAVEVTASANLSSGGSDAPAQPFYSHWLILAAMVIGLMAWSTSNSSALQRFALRFSIIYWLFYSLPSPFASLFAFADLSDVVASYGQGVESMVRWAARNVLGLEGELVLPRGSGDPVYSYVKLLVGFALAFAGAGVWSLVDRKDRDRTWLRDLLRSYLRYVLALTLLGYGLAKAGFVATQFGTVSDWRLERTFGESSPMGLLWTFMAASPAYTFFSGIAEVVAGLLLIPRRTATLGGLCAFAVMLNIVMLNFCYDVPVKLYSFHLMLMGVLVALPDGARLFGVFLLNRATEPVDLNPPYTGRRTVIGYRLLKLAAFLYLFAWPIFEHTKSELTHEHPSAVESEHLLMNRGFRWTSEVPFNR
jgi:hypothetical protein